jgi:hypothetical protein
VNDKGLNPNEDLTSGFPGSKVRGSEFGVWGSGFGGLGA